jgi:hypothetical protein
MRIFAFLLILVQLAGCSKSSQLSANPQFTIEASRKAPSHRRYIWEVEERPYRVFDRGIWMHPRGKAQSRWARILVPEGLSRDAAAAVLGEIYEEFGNDIEASGPSATFKHITLFLYSDEEIAGTDSFGGYIAVVQVFNDGQQKLPPWSPTLVQWAE